MIGGVYDPLRRQRQWTLESLVDQAKFDLSDFDSVADSGSAALAAGLLAAIRGGRSNPKIWASAQWNDGTFSRVENLDKKLALAKAWGADKFYVAHNQTIEPRDRPNGCPESFVSRLKKPTDDDDPRYGTRAERALSEMLKEFGIEPDLERDGEDRSRDWYVNCEDWDQATTFYYRCLLDRIADRCREELLPSIAAAGINQPRMVTILSTSLVSLLVARIVKPVTVSRSAQSQKQIRNQVLTTNGWRTISLS